MDQTNFDLDKLCWSDMQPAYDKALRDAVVLGTGVVMMTSDETGIEAVNIDPEQFFIKPPPKDETEEQEACKQMGRRIAELEAEVVSLRLRLEFMSPHGAIVKSGVQALFMRRLDLGLMVWCR